jgi:hypothetical protein
MLDCLGRVAREVILVLSFFTLMSIDQMTIVCDSVNLFNAYIDAVFFKHLCIKGF